MKRVNVYDLLDEEEQKVNANAKRPKIEEIVILDDDEDSEKTEEVVFPAIETEKAKLSESQSKALDLVLAGKNVFITGGAGSGKSYLIDTIKTRLEELGKTYYTTATTGSASFHIGGTTVHSYAGAGIGESTLQKTIKDIEKNKDKVARWKNADVLIIDEISMLDPDYLDLINEVGKIMRKKPNLPFGGIQIILTGDYLQLPPIPNKRRPPTDDRRYSFQTTTWKELDLTMINLDFNFRQQSDDTYKKLLHSLRLGKLSPEEHALLASRDVSRLSKHEKIDDTNMTKLFAYRADVQRTNNEALGKIDAPVFHFEAEIYLCPALLKKQEEQAQYNNNKPVKTFNYPVEEVIELKVGASVLLCYNLDTEAGLYNGAKGVITEFHQIIPKGTPLEKIGEPNKNFKFPVVRFYNGDERPVLPYTWQQKENKLLVSSFTQLPLILAYACTIHRSQGLTLTNGLVNAKCFETGQFYVACSRFRELKGLHLTNFINNNNIKAQIMADPIVIRFYEKHELL